MSKSERGYQAQQLLDNTIFQECLAALELEYLDRWQKANTTAAREDLHRYVAVLRRIPNDIRSIVTTGTLERARIKELESSGRVLKWPMI